MAKPVAKTLSLFDLMRKYPTELSATRYIERMRWGDTCCCVRCGSSDKITERKDKPANYWCGDCRKYFNAKTGTPLEHTRIRDPRKWIFASYLLMTSRKGISALQLKHELKVSYSTAWYMLHRLRVACGDQMEALHGTVEIDETYLGGKDKNKHSDKKSHRQHYDDKQAVLGMRERGGNVKAMPISDTTKTTLHDAVHSHVRPGSMICTDDNPSYSGVSYRHCTVNHSAKEYVNGMAHTNGIESVWAVLKRGFNGVYHNWSKKHCRHYVNEFAFRLNEGNVKRDTQDRLDSLFRSMAGKRITYKELVS